MADTSLRVRTGTVGHRWCRRVPVTLSVALVIGVLLASNSAWSQNVLSPAAEGPELVTPRIERAIEDGITWLLSLRGQDGIWRNAVRPRRASYPSSNTALAGLVLLANGSTPTRGPHARVVGEITEYLLSSSQSTGLITDSRLREDRPMYSHAFGLTFLASVLGQEGQIERRRRIEGALARGIVLLGRAQTDDGGWGYTPNYWEDEGTLVATELAGLRMCRDAGIPVPRGIIEQALNYIRMSSRSDGRVMYRARSERYRRGVTCATIVALWHAGLYDSPEMIRTRRWVNTQIAPETGAIWSDAVRDPDHGEYIEYFLAQAMWIQGGEIWARHYRAISDYLVSIQKSDGSWYGSDSRDYGTIYSTAMALLILQLPYQRLTLYQK